MILIATIKIKIIFRRKLKKLQDAQVLYIKIDKIKI